MAELIFPIGITLLAALAFANGSNDVSKGIATLVGSGVTDYRRAMVWGTVWTVMGGVLAIFFSTAMMEIFTDGILSETAGTIRESPALSIAVMVGAMSWVIFASRVGLPVSTTHAIIGALCGGGLAALGWDGIQWASLIHTVAIPLALSPLIAIGIAVLILPITRWALSGWKEHCICVLPVQKAPWRVEQRDAVRMVAAQTELVMVVDAHQCAMPRALSMRIGPETFHWMTCGLTSLARGLNDTPKMAALFVGFSLFSDSHVPNVTILAFGVVALSMGLGSLLGGLKVTELLAEKVTRMDHHEGFSANLTTALLVIFASRFGVPVSTTHVSAGAIIGMGLHKGSGQVNWKTVREMVLAWGLTLPVAGLMAAGCWIVLEML